MKQYSVTCSHVETSPCSGLKIAMSITIDANCLIKWHQNYLRWRVKPSCVFPSIFHLFLMCFRHVFPSCVCHVFPVFLMIVLPMCFSRVSCVSHALHMFPHMFFMCFSCFPCVSRVFLMFPKYFPYLMCFPNIFRVSHVFLKYFSCVSPMYFSCFSSIFRVSHV